MHIINFCLILITLTFVILIFVKTKKDNFTSSIHPIYSGDTIRLQIAKFDPDDGPPFHPKWYTTVNAWGRAVQVCLDQDGKQDLTTCVDKNYKRKDGPFFVKIHNLQSQPGTAKYILDMGCPIPKSETTHIGFEATVPQGGWGPAPNIFEWMVNENSSYIPRWSKIPSSSFFARFTWDNAKWCVGDYVDGPCGNNPFLCYNTIYQYLVPLEGICDTHLQLGITDKKSGNQLIEHGGILKPQKNHAVRFIFVKRDARSPLLPACPSYYAN